MLHGAAAVAQRATMFIRPVLQVRPSLVNRAADVILAHEDRLIALLASSS